MQPNMKILAVNIPEEISKTLLSNFFKSQYTITMNENLYSQTTSKMLENHQIVIVQTDNNLYSPEQLSLFCQSNPFIEVIGILSTNNIEKHRYIQAGLFDLITDNCSLDDLTTILLKAAKAQKNKSELSVLKQFVAMNYGFDNLIGNSKQMTQLKEKIKKVSPTDISVMLSGPSGSGKSLTAKIIHHHSERRKQPFVTLDSASTPETIFDDILFGDTESNRPALLSKADNGTLFIKDLHLLPTSTQHKLIRFLHSYKLENSDITKKLSVRLISSTNHNMNSLVNSGAFEKELFHLLSEVSISTPHLKERLDDIEPLAEYFVRKISYETNRRMHTLSRSALELLYNHHWSENIRELENTIKRASTLCRTSQIEENDILFIESANANSSTNRFTVDIASDQGNGILDEGQRSLIVKTLNDNNWNYTQTAQELGIGRTTLWRKVKKYDLKKESTELV